MQLSKQLKAFTLVELIMVVTIIGMMAVFVIPNYNKSVAKAYEKAASNNLLIIYAAQQNESNNNNSYKAGANVGVINSNLGLSIIANNMDYVCTSPGNSFTCTAARDDGSFTLTITNASPTVCCGAGTCPSIPDC